VKQLDAIPVRLQVGAYLLRLLSARSKNYQNKKTQHKSFAG
jgi:hypothetical protein